MESSNNDDEIQRHVSIVGRDPIAKDLEVRIEVEVLQSTITSNKTALLQFTTINNGPERAISIGTGQHCHIFNRADGNSDQPQGLTLRRPHSMKSIDRKGDRWELDLPSDASPGYRMYRCPPKVYAPGESVSDEYEIWHDYRVEGYLNPGIYRWEKDIRIWDTPNTEGVEPSTITWSFTLNLADVE